MQNVNVPTVIAMTTLWICLGVFFNLFNELLIVYLKNKLFLII